MRQTKCDAAGCDIANGKRCPADVAEGFTAIAVKECTKKTCTAGKHRIGCTDAEDTKCDAAAYAVAVRRMAAQVAAADGGGGGFAARLAKMRAEAKESGVVPLPEHPIRWKPGVLCGAPQGYIGPDNLAVYTPRRYDPVCNMTQVVVGVSGSTI